MMRSTIDNSTATAPPTDFFAATPPSCTGNSTIRKTWRLMKSFQVLSVWIAAVVSSSLCLTIVESRIVTTTTTAAAAGGGSSAESNVAKMTQHQRQRWRNRPSVMIGDPAEVHTTATATTTTNTVTGVEDEDGTEEELDELEEDMENDVGWLGDLNHVVHTNQMNIMDYARGRGQGGVSSFGLAVDRHDVTMTYKQLEMAMSMPASIEPTPPGGPSTTPQPTPQTTPETTSTPTAPPPSTPTVPSPPTPTAEGSIQPTIGGGPVAPPSTTPTDPQPPFETPVAPPSTTPTDPQPASPPSTTPTDPQPASPPSTTPTDPQPASPPSTTPTDPQPPFEMPDRTLSPTIASTSEPEPIPPSSSSYHFDISYSVCSVQTILVVGWATIMFSVVW